MPSAPDSPGPRAHLSVGAVIPVYRPGPELVTSVTRLATMVSLVVLVVDEAPVPQATEQVLTSCQDLGAVVVRHDRNRGIGAALNTGWRTLRQCRDTVDMVLTLDQDSLVPEGYVEQVLAAYHRARSAGVRTGMVAPGSVASVSRGHEARDTDGGVVLGGEPIQSGLLVPREVLEELDGFDESLFIDGVDSDFYLRCRTRGYQCVLAPGTRLEHRLGVPLRVPGGLDLPFLVSADFRYYYQWRNLLLLLRRHLRAHPLWSVRAVGRLIRHLIIVTVLAPGRATRLHYARAGLVDGLRGRRGRLSDERARRITR